jgi:hypothetical protein
LGFTYRSSIVCTEPGPQGEPGDWRQSTTPGARAPHAWLEPGKSTLDLFGRGFVLLSFGTSDGAPDGASDSASNDTAAAVDAFAGRRIPLDTTVCHDPEVAALYERRFVLVRPDGHVAWRGDELPAQLDELVDKVRGAV